MHILITGGSGFIGRYISRALMDDGHQVSVLTRKRKRAARRLDSGVGLIESLDALEGAQTPEVVINLAGENLTSGRWSAARKKRFRDSRLHTTERLVDWMSTREQRPALLINASAVGYYGMRDDAELDERSPAGDDFAAHLCRDWEAAADRAAELGPRVAKLRLGIVLGREGGAFARMLTPFRLGLGGRFGDGRQWMSWIHIEDVSGLIRHIINRTTLKGALNATAPVPVRNLEFTRSLAACLRRPALMPLPGWFLEAAFGELAMIFLKGQRVLPRAALDSGYVFKFPELAQALEDLIYPERRAGASPVL